MEATSPIPEPIRYRSPRARANWAIVAIAVTTGIAIANGAAVAGVLAGRSAPDTAIAAATVAVLLAPVVEAIALPVAIGPWAFRCRRNLGVVAGAHPRWSPGWAACGWFVPVANLFVPLLSLRETWSVSSGRAAPLLLLPWWVLWVARAVPLLWLTVEVLPRWHVALGVASAAAAALSGIGAIVVVVLLTLVQERRLRPLREGAGAVPTWSRPPRPARVTAYAAIAAVSLATLGGAVMLSATAVSLALGSFSLVYGPVQLVAVWGAGLAAYALFGLVVGMIAIALWARQAYRSLPSPGAASPSWSPAWAAASWFVPIANLLLPYVILRDAWPGRGRALLRAWWAAWLASLALGVASGVLHVTTLDVTQLAGDVTGVIGDLALLPAGALAVAVILTITRHQLAAASAGA
jgi:hypothetical protein